MSIPCGITFLHPIPKNEGYDERRHSDDRVQAIPMAANHDAVVVGEAKGYIQT